jgi:hypothetical protein
MIFVRLRVDDGFSGLGDGHAERSPAVMVSKPLLACTAARPPVRPTTNQLLSRYP